MDSSDPNRNPSDVSSNKNIEEEKVNPSPESRTEEEAPAANASPPEAPALMPQPLDDREYGCKYCTKKFSNKQALGGHQNAHKIERAMEKNPRDPVPEGHFPYGFAGGSGAAAAVGGDTLSYTGLMMMMSNSNPNPSSHHHHHFLGSCNNRSHEFVNRSTTVNWPYSSSSSHHHQQQQQQQQQQQLLNQRQALQIRYNNPSTPAYVAPRPLPGYSNVNSGWTAPQAPAPGQPPRVSNPYNNTNNNNSYNYPGQPSHMHNQNQAAAQVMNNSNLRLHHPMTIGGGGGAMMRPGSHQGFGGGPRIGPGNMVNPGGENRNTMMVNQPVNEQVEDSDMDLSLKL